MGTEPQDRLDALRDALRNSERPLEAIVDALGDPVTIRDPHDRILYANPAAVSLMGFESWPQVGQISPGDLMAPYRITDEHGRPVSDQDLPSARILRGLPATPLLVQAVNLATRERRWQLIKSAPLTDRQGRVEATVTTIEDVTEAHLAAVEATFLAEAGRVLASSLDYEQTLRNVAELAVPGIVDWCAVDLRTPDGGRHPVAVAHADPAKRQLAERLRAYEPERPEPDEGLGLVFRTGEPLLYPEIPDEMLIRGAVDERHLALLRAVGMSSAIVVPIAIGQRILGAMTLVTAESGRVLDPFDLRLAEQVAARAAVAIENARLYSQRSQIAHTLQESLAPDALPAIPDFELASVYVPALSGAEVGGDFYDAWRTDTGWVMAIGDVTGKGAKAAALTALVRHTLRAVSDYEFSPARLLARVDRALKRQPQLSICTALCLRLDDDRITLAIAGHPLPLVVGADGVHTVGEAGPLLGAFADAGWTEKRFSLPPGASLVAYTDGVTDALGSDGSRYGNDRLSRLLAGASSRGATALAQRIGDTLDSFQAEDHVDDTAVLVLHHRAGLATAATGPVDAGGLSA